jgi:hypothetical protein
MARRASGYLSRAIGLAFASVVLEIVAQLAPPHYSAIRDSESALAIGPYGYLESVSLCLRAGTIFFVLRAAPLVLSRSALSPIGAWLLALAAAAKIVIAFVPTDLGPRPETFHGMVHAGFAFTGLFAAAIGGVLVSRKLPKELWASVLQRLAQIAVAWTVLITATVGIRLGYWGLFERIETALLLGWVVLLAVALQQRAPTIGDANEERS